MSTISSMTTVLIVVFVFAITVSHSKSQSESPPDFPCKSPRHSHYSFCDTSLSVSARAHALVSLLTLPEKVSQLCNNASAVPRLGVPAYEWWSEALHGLATNGPGVSFGGAVPAATSFPQVLVQAASFSRDLWRRTAAAVAVEARAMYNSGRAGLTFWAPNVNVFRDPRWGRGQETPGEDPFVSSEFAVEFVTAFQGGKNGGGAGVLLEAGGGDLVDDGGGGLMLSACCKHFSAYDLEMWGNFARYNFNAVVTDQDFEDTYQAPFRSCVEKGKASCLMCSYNAVNGVPACARKELLDQARKEWGFKGYITSDCDAVATVNDYQHYTKTPEDAVAEVLKAGTDINCGTYLLLNTLSAIQQGKVEEEELDRALVNLFSVQIRLGLFDGDPSKGKYGSLGPRDICSSEHKELALEGARQGIVLLKNDKKFLPLNKDAVSSLALIGPWANDSTVLGGGYSGIPCSRKSLYEAFEEHVEMTSYALGCHNVSCDSDGGFEEAVGIAREADYVIMILGIGLFEEREDHDRVSLLLPGKQMDLVSSVAAASKKPVILVLTGGGPLDVSFAETHPRVASILWIGYPGEAGGQALAEILFGHVNPSGRLAMTWYPEAYTKIPMDDMRMRSNPSRGYPGRTYRFYSGSTVYEFGHGLSYVNFTYRSVSIPEKLSLSLGSFKHVPGRRVAEEQRDYVYVDEVAHCDSLRVPLEVGVKNLGGSDGRHVFMVYLKPPKGVEGAPEKQLVVFESVFVVSGGMTKVSVSIDACSQLSFSDERGRRVIPLGIHLLLFGDLEYSISVEI